MFIKEEKVTQRAKDLGFTPLENTAICAKLNPFSEKTLLERGINTFKEYMKFETPDSYFSVILCTTTGLLILPLSWWTIDMKKNEYKTIPYTDITGFTPPEAKVLNWYGRLATTGGEYELIISDEKLTAAKLSGSAFLDGDWQKNNLPNFIKKLEETAAQ